MAAPTKCQTCPIFTQRQTTPPGKKLRPQRKFHIHTELEIICRYCNGESSQHIAQDKHCTPDTVQNILRQYGKPPRTLRDAQLLRRGSADLTFPRSTEVPHLLTNPNIKPYIPHLIAIMLLTDGGAGYRQGHRPYITFTNKAQPLHAIFADLNHYYYHQPPSAYFEPYWSKPNKQGSKAYYTTYNRKDDTEKILQELLLLSPTFRTRPKLGQSWEQYIKESPQPTIHFLFNSEIPQDIHSFAIRIAMSTEGTISPIFRNDSTKPYPHLVFASKHPLLRAEWNDYFKKNGFEFEPNARGIETAKIRTAKKFLQIGGFFPGILVRKGSYYESLTRQQVLKAIFEVRKSETIEPALDISKKHTIIRKYAENSTDQ